MFIFTGKYPHTIDTKDRIQIPAVQRNQLSQKLPDAMEAKEGLFFQVTYFKGTPCLYAYPQILFDEKMSELSAECNSFFAPQEKMKTFRRITANAQLCRCDSQGRIIIPKEHLQYANLEKEALVVGVGDHIELWNPKVYQEEEKENLH